MSFAVSKISCLLASDFHGKLDDTLVNRLCTCLLCRDSLHSIFWSDISPELWDLYHKYFIYWLQNFQETESSDFLLKIFICLLNRNYFISMQDCTICDAVTLLFNKGSKNLRHILVECLHLCVQATNSLQDLQMIKWISDNSVICKLLKQLHEESNIHQSKKVINILAHSYIIGIRFENETSIEPIMCEILKLSEIGIDIMILSELISRKFNIVLKTSNALVDSALTIDEFFQLTTQKQSSLLYLICCGMLFNPYGDKSFIQFMENLSCLLQLCVSVMTMYLKWGGRVYGCLWNFLFSSWQKFIVAYLNFASFNLISVLIHPVCTSSNNHLPYFELQEIVLSKAFEEALSGAEGSKTTNAVKYRTQLWLFLKCLTVGVSCSNLSALELHRFLNYLNSSYCTTESTFCLNELNSALDFFICLCIRLFKSPQSDIYEHIKGFLKFAESISISHRGFSSISFCCLHILKALETHENFVAVLLLFWEYLVHLFDKLFSHLCGFYMESQQDSHTISELVSMVMKYLCDPNYLQCWTKRLQIYCLQVFKGIATSPNAFIILDGFNTRGLLLSTFIKVVSFGDIENSPLKTINEDVDVEWVPIFFTRLVDFDFMELSESRSVIKLLKNNIEFLESTLINCPNELNQMIVETIKSKFSKQLGESYMKSLEINQLDGICSTCKENMNELLDDILLTSKSNVYADCTEG